MDPRDIILLEVGWRRDFGLLFLSGSPLVELGRVEIAKMLFDDSLFLYRGPDEPNVGR